MLQISDQDEDIIIHLGDIHGNDGVDKDEIYYNVSDFLRHHDSNICLRKRIASISKLANILDKKVYINTSDQCYSHIYKGIDIIVKRLVAELTKSDEYFADAKLRKTGSSMSGLKVGLPHESDYVLELPEYKPEFEYMFLIHSKRFYNLVEPIIKYKKEALTEGLMQWVIHGVTEHRKTGGVYLVMHVSTTAVSNGSLFNRIYKRFQTLFTGSNDPIPEEVGVTVDITPVCKIKTPHETLNGMAETFLPHSLEQYAREGYLCTLDIFDTICDTGLIENALMKQLPQDTKRAFRVSKFIISSLSGRPNDIPFDTIQSLDGPARQRLYGLKSGISSYMLRILFFHLLVHVKGTQAKRSLRGDLLILCLLDMLKQCHDKRSNDNIISLRHPFIKERVQLFYDFVYPQQRMEDFMDWLDNENTEILETEKINLLNG